VQASGQTDQGTRDGAAVMSATCLALGKTVTLALISLADSGCVNAGVAPLQGRAIPAYALHDDDDVVVTLPWPPASP
jgi:hypothetical protein